jgi:alpha-amylase/alpha-mannosidase (GH57 family)
MFTDLILKHPKFRITLSMSGTFLEQAQLYHPGVINALRTLLDAGKESQQVEFLDETYYHSLTCLYADPHKQEFRDQVSLHRERIRKLFGVFPVSFRNTELMYNNTLADIVADMGYLSILCETENIPNLLSKPEQLFPIRHSMPGIQI